MGGSSSKQKKQESYTYKGKTINLKSKGDRCKDDYTCKSKRCINKDKQNVGKCAGGAITNLNYQDKYIKYKSKYLNLKEKNNSF
jgi:hypothetical protein